MNNFNELYESHISKKTSTYEGTHWTNGKTKVTIQDVEKLLDQLKVSEINIPTAKIKHLDIHTKHAPNKSDIENKSTKERALRADLKYPIIISKNSAGEYTMILDGNHRLHKATLTKQPTIKAKVLDLTKVPKEWLELFENTELEE